MSVPHISHGEQNEAGIVSALLCLTVVLGGLFGAAVVLHWIFSAI